MMPWKLYWTANWYRSKIRLVPVTIMATAKATPAGIMAKATPAGIMAKATPAGIMETAMNMLAAATAAISRHHESVNGNFF